MTKGKTTFAKSERLKRPAEIRSLLKNAPSVRQSGVVLYFVKNQPSAPSRFAVTISKRVLKRAVDRNKAKRIAREYFRLSKPNFSGKFDLLVRISDGSKLFKDNELRINLNRLFKQAKILAA